MCNVANVFRDRTTYDYGSEINADSTIKICSMALVPGTTQNGSGTIQNNGYFGTRTLK